MDQEALTKELVVAAWSGQLQLVQDLVERGALVNAKVNSLTALMMAAEQGHVDVVHWHAEHGANLNVTGSKHQRTALVHAALHGHSEVVRCLAYSGADLNVPDAEQRTALMVTAEQGHINVVRCLAECGANLDAIDGSRWTALSLAVIEEKFDVTRLLVQVGAKVDVPEARSALIFAAEHNLVPAVQLLVELGANVNATNWRGEIALHHATKGGHQQVIRILMPQVQTPGFYGSSPTARRQPRGAGSLGVYIPPFEMELLGFADDASVGETIAQSGWMQTSPSSSLLMMRRTPRSRMKYACGNSCGTPT